MSIVNLPEDFVNGFVNVLSTLSLIGEHKIKSSSNDEIIAELKKAGMSEEEANKNVIPTRENALMRIQNLERFVPHYLDFLVKHEHLTFDDLQSLYNQLKVDSAARKYQDFQNVFLAVNGVKDAKEFLDKIAAIAG